MKAFFVIFLLLARTLDLVDIFRYAWLVPTGELPWEVVPPLAANVVPTAMFAAALALVVVGARRAVRALS